MAKKKSDTDQKEWDYKKNEGYADLLEAGNASSSIRADLPVTATQEYQHSVTDRPAKGYSTNSELSKDEPTKEELAEQAYQTLSEKGWIAKFKQNSGIVITAEKIENFIVAKRQQHDASYMELPEDRPKGKKTKWGKNFDALFTTKLSEKEFHAQRANLDKAVYSALFGEALVGPAAQEFITTKVEAAIRLNCMRTATDSPLR